MCTPIHNESLALSFILSPGFLFLGGDGTYDQHEREDRLVEPPWRLRISLCISYRYQSRLLKLGEWVRGRLRKAFLGS